eukprot:TRINITY_DN28236_c0_g1_i2.p1 TRINITY_DN28236_c0_g1~~TRINITY_DN28236_c0_g1_i2.p1  ORF type:complete len:248 (-),score=23.28 TRINITY_DN28236_c0_g1_i2:104-793(-)
MFLSACALRIVFLTLAFTSCGCSRVASVDSRANVGEEAGPGTGSSGVVCEATWVWRPRQGNANVSCGEVNLMEAESDLERLIGAGRVFVKGVPKYSMDDLKVVVGEAFISLLQSYNMNVLMELLQWSFKSERVNAQHVILDIDTDADPRLVVWVWISKVQAFSAICYPRVGSMWRHLKLKMELLGDMGCDDAASWSVDAQFTSVNHVQEVRALWDRRLPWRRLYSPAVP